MNGFLGRITLVLLPVILMDATIAVANDDTPPGCERKLIAATTPDEVTVECKTGGRLELNAAFFDYLLDARYLHIDVMDASGAHGGAAILSARAFLNVMGLFGLWVNADRLDVEASAFEQVPALETLLLNGLTAIPEKLFTGMRALQSLYLTSTSTSWPQDLFYGLTSLRTLSFDGPVPPAQIPAMLRRVPELREISPPGWDQRSLGPIMRDTSSDVFIQTPFSYGSCDEAKGAAEAEGNSERSVRLKGCALVGGISDAGQVASTCEQRDKHDDITFSGKWSMTFTCWSH